MFNLLLSPSGVNDYIRIFSENKYSTFMIKNQLLKFGIKKLKINRLESYINAYMHNMHNTCF